MARRWEWAGPLVSVAPRFTVNCARLPRLRRCKHDIRAGNRKRARTAAEARGEALPAAEMFQAYRRSAIRQPSIPPRQHRQWHRVEVEAFLREEIFMAGWAQLVGALLKDAMVDEALEALAKDIGRYAELLLEIVKAFGAVEQFTND